MLSDDNKINFFAFIVAFCLSIVVFNLTLTLNLPMRYPDFIVGSSTWGVASKLQDLLAWPVTTIVGISVFFLTKYSLVSVDEQYGSLPLEQTYELLLLCSIPSFTSFAAAFFSGQLNLYLHYLSALALVFILTTCLLSMRYKKDLDIKSLGLVLVCCYFLSLTPYAIHLFFGRLPLGWLNLSFSYSLSHISYYIFIVSLSLTGALIAFREERLKSFLPLVIMVSQWFLPLFFLVLYPARLLQENGALVKYPSSNYLLVLIACLIVLTYADLIRRYLKRAIVQPASLFSPWVLIALLIFLKIGLTNAPIINQDDYHFGEYLLGVFSYKSGLIPYVDYIPAHGVFENDFGALLNSVFFDGTAASQLEATRVLFSIVILVTFFVVYHFFQGNMLFSFAVVLLLSGRHTWFLCAVIVYGLLNHKLLISPARWLACWVLVSPIIILAVPPQGVLLVASFGLIALKMTYDIVFNDHHRRDLKYIVFVLLFWLFLIVLTPVDKMLLGAVRYVFENGVINQVAYGISWGFMSSPMNQGFFFELIRMVWAGCFIYAIYILIINYKGIKSRFSVFYRALIVSVFLALLIPYSMGRIDPGGISRPGIVSIFALVCVLLLLTYKDKEKAKFPYVLLVVTVVNGMLLGTSSVTESKMQISVNPLIHTQNMIDATSIGLGNVGFGYLEPSHLNRLMRLNSILQNNLRADETYLDLSSRNAHYFYLNRLPSMLVTAPYNLVSIDQQLRAVSLLRKNSPRVALLEANNIAHDGGGLALRSYWLYRYVMDTYDPIYQGGFIFGEKRDSDLSSFDRVKVEVEKARPIYNRSGQLNLVLVLSDKELVKFLSREKKLTINNEEEVNIVSTNLDNLEVVVDVSNAHYNALQLPGLVELKFSPEQVFAYKNSLYQRSFSVVDYQKIPEAWGRSEITLLGRMNHIKTFDVSGAYANDMTFSSTGYRVNGVDPYVVFDLSPFGISGKNTGILRLEFECIGQTEEPRLQVFWWGNNTLDPFEDSSVRFTASNGVLLVPLDASPWWSNLNKVNGIRLDLDNAAACASIMINKVSLYRRNSQK